MLEPRLENEIDTNFTIFGNENDRKRKEVEVDFQITSSKFDKYDQIIYNVNCFYFLDHIQSANERAEMQRKIQQMQHDLNNRRGGTTCSIL